MKNNSLFNVARLAAACLWLVLGSAAAALSEMKTWDGKYPIDQIDLTVVYFVPADRRPLPDWRDRADYFCRRIKLFHRREFQGQSVLNIKVYPTPLVSKNTTDQLRRGDANAIFFRTLREAEDRIHFGRKPGSGFPILLVLSDINWRPLDDFYRLKPEHGRLEFEGTYSRDEHFPGARSGGARASYLANRGVGWALVSADGWRVPYRGSDCVVYHEGCGHTVGLPHPKPPNGSVMSLGQYRGWLSESWIDEDQKTRLGWKAKPRSTSPELELFSHFRALPEPRVPKPNQSVALKLDWPPKARVKSLRVRYQTSLDSPWIDVPQSWEGNPPGKIPLGTFDRPTPVSYRIDVETVDGAQNELWGYFQVRAEPDVPPTPIYLSPDLIECDRGAGRPVFDGSDLPSQEVDLLQNCDLNSAWAVGQWTVDSAGLVSPKRYGARLQLPYSPPPEYRLVAVVEPLDKPNGLILGQRCGGRRFLVLINFTPKGVGKSAIENVDGRNVGNQTTFTGDLLKQGRPSEVIVTVTKSRVTVSVDGWEIIDWHGSPDRLSLSDYWKTPDERALFVGAYDCRYRFYRLSLEPLKGQGQMLSGGTDQEKATMR